MYRLFLCHYSLLVVVDEKCTLGYHFLLLQVLSCYINTETDVPEHQQRWWLKHRKHVLVRTLNLQV